MPVPNTFANATTSIPLSQLDQNFATAITLGNTAIQLGNTVTTLNNMTLANVTVSSGNVTVTSLSGAFNGTVGATTPNTGAFTTLTASSGATVSATSGYYFTVKDASVATGFTAGTITFTNAAQNAYSTGTYNATSHTFQISGSSTVGTFSSTGLAVTGSASATAGSLYASITDNTNLPIAVFQNNQGSGSARDAYVKFRLGTDTYSVGHSANTNKFTIANGTTLGSGIIMAMDTNGVAVTGTVSATTNLIAGIRNNITSTDRISVTGATTIFSLAGGAASVGASGAVLLVNGYNIASNTNSFIDLVLFIGNNTPTVLGSVNRGSPAARTYTASGSSLQLAMASGTYNVANSSIEQAC